MKVGDLVRHKLHAGAGGGFPDSIYLIVEVWTTSFQILGCHSFYPVHDYEVIN